MPELPESDAERLNIARDCLNRTIAAGDLGEDTDHVDLPGDDARQRLVGHQFTQTGRHGKYIFAGSKTGPWIVVHLGMTGSLIAFDAPDDPPDDTRVLIRFEGDRRLAFRCPRKLGKVEFTAARRLVDPSPHRWRRLPAPRRHHREDQSGWPFRLSLHAASGMRRPIGTRRTIRPFHGGNGASDGT